jgi:hypothetical protein
VRWAAIAVVVVLVGFIAYSVMYPTTSYRFRITLDVDTPQGPRSGSSVMEVRIRRYPAWMTLGNNTGGASLTGEAVFVDLGSGADGRPRNVIALLALGPRGEDPNLNWLPDKVFEPLWAQKFRQPGFRGSSLELPKLPAGTKAELRGDLIPTLATFSDLSDPNTLRVVKPDDFEQAFGAGVRLNDVTMEIVTVGPWPLSMTGLSGEPVTRGIAKRLPWWEKPLPWLKPVGGGVFVDVRQNGFKWNKSYFERGA